MLESEKIDSVTGRIEVNQDRLSIVDDGSGSLYVSQKWRNTPLGSNETHATIKLSTTNGQVKIALDGEDLDAMVDALHHIQEAYKND